MAVWGGSRWAGPAWATVDGPIGPADPLAVDLVECDVIVFDVPGMFDPRYYGPIQPDLLEIQMEVYGPAVTPDPVFMGSIKPDPVEIQMVVFDPLPLTVAPPVPPGGVPFASPLALTVSGVTVVGGSVAPAMNSKGSGSFTSTTPLAPGTEVTMSVGGIPALIGVVATSEIAKVSMAEYAETYNNSVEGHLREWEKAIIFPDFGSGYGANNSPQARLGSPKQTTRFFDWTMNGGVSRSDYHGGQTVGRNPIEAALAKPPLPLPDGWMDEYAEWMWITKPGQSGSGWSNMRNVTSNHGGGRTLFEVCMYDSGQVWIDGVLVLEVAQAGVRVSTIIDLTPGNHLVALRCHNGGGNAGVMFSALPIVNGKVDPRNNNLLRSASGWLASQVQHNPAPQSLVLATQRLMKEVQSRGFLTGWSVGFASSYYGEPTTEALTADVGMSMMEWLERITESYVDYYALGRSVTLVRKGSTFSSGFSTPWTQGVNLSSSGTEASLW